MLVLPKASSRSDYTLEAPVILLGDFAYIGTVKGRGGHRSSCKFIAKKRACASSKAADARLLLERNILTALGGSHPCIPKIACTYQDAKVIMLIYADTFQCDLALAISNGAIGTD